MVTTAQSDAFRLAGFDEEAILAKQALIERCTAALSGGTPAFVFFVPGRVEVLGKHTDYAGGRSMTCAVDRGFVVAVRPRTDRQIVVRACDLDQSIEFELSPELRPADNGWANYVMTVAQRVARNFGAPLNGADIALASDLPQAAGMSSSSALVIATWLALDAVNRFSDRSVFRQEIRRGEDLAGYLGTCENGQSFGRLEGAKGVGTFGGSEDHTAILCSTARRLSVYTYNPVRLERQVALPSQLALIIGASGVVAEKTAAARERYNRISLLARAIMEVLESHGWQKPSLAAVIRDDGEVAQTVRNILSTSRHPLYRRVELLSRFEQFAAEHQRLIPQAADALECGDFAKFSEAVAISQAMAETSLENQTAETVALVKQARDLGAVAASAFGAGFGGSVWALTPREEADRFAARWLTAYRRQFPNLADRAHCFRTQCVSGATRLA